MAETKKTDQYDHHRGRQPLLRPTNPWRSGAFLAVNLVGFFVVNAFWQYLVTGQWTNFAPSAYQRDLTTPLGELLIYPLNILTHRWMILVTGLLLALVIFVPIIVAVLYRLIHAAVFVAIVGVVGHAPVLALAMAIGCILASHTRLRSDMPFLAALLGMVPAAIYFYLFAFAGVDSPAALPLQRWVLHAPFALAAISAILAAAIVLAMTRLTGFRPGVVWPVLAVLAAVPLAIFYAKIGPDELEYALIANRLAPGDAILKSRTLAEWSGGNTAVVDPVTLKIRVQKGLEGRTRRLMADCERFLAKRTLSKRTPAVLWIEAQCMSLQLDEPALSVGLVKYTASYPLEVSGEVWQRLKDDAPHSPQAALARWRLGQLALRRSDVRVGYEHLTAAAEKLQKLATAFAAKRLGEPMMRIFCNTADVPSERYYAEALLEAQRLLWLIKRNDILNDKAAAEALAAYLSVEPNRSGYYESLCKLAGTYEKTSMGDNLKLAVAQATENCYEKAQQLIQIAKDERTDAAIEANFELGQLARGTANAPALSLMPQLKSPQAYFKLVLAAPGNPWQKLAAERLSWLSSQRRLE